MSDSIDQGQERCEDMQHTREDNTRGAALALPIEVLPCWISRRLALGTSSFDRSSQPPRPSARTAAPPLRALRARWPRYPSHAPPMT